MSTRIAALTFLACAACGGVQPVTTTGALEAQVSARPALRVHGGTVSRDGQLFAYVDWSSGTGYGVLVVRDLVTGENRSLTDPQTQRGDVETIRFSADGGQLAHSWYDYDTERFEVRITAVDGSRTRTLLSVSSDSAWYEVAGWTAGDSAVVAVGGAPGPDPAGGTEMLRIPVSGGAPTVRALGTGVISDSEVSPDGRYLAYHRRERWDAPNADVHVRTLDSPDDVRITSSPAGEYLLAWGPQGIFYLTREEGSPTVWLQAVEGSRAVGEPLKVLSEVWGIGGGIGVGGDRLFYHVPIREMQVMEIALGQEGATPVAVSDPIRDDWVAHPAWSPDGALLAYVRREFWPWTVHKQSLVLRETTTRLERVVPTPLFTVLNTEWEPGGRGLFLVGLGYDAVRRELYRFDVASGSFNLVAYGDTVRLPRRSPDGRTEYRMLAAPRPHLAAIDVETGAARRLWEGAGNAIAVSPDGETLAFTEMADSRERLRVVSITSGESRVLHEMNGGRLRARMVWTRDGTAIIAAAGPNQAGELEVLRIPVDRGEPRVLLRRAIGALAIDPDARRLVYVTSHEPAHAYGVWSIDNVSSISGKR